MLKCFISLLILFTFIPFTTVYSDDVNHLLSIYGGQVKLSKDDAERDLNNSLEKYINAVRIVDGVNSFNRFLEFASMEQEEQKLLVQSAIDEIFTENDEIVNTVTNNFESDDIDMLLSLDLKFKNNVDEINLLYKSMDKFTIVDSKTVPVDIDIESFKNDVSVKTSAFEEAISSVELGNVRNVKHPLKNDFYVTSEYGTRVNPITKKGSQFHSGLDLRAAYNTEVTALFNGVVVKAGQDWSLGNYVKIQHADGIISLYGHLNEHRVKSGDVVKQGDAIALSGSTGQSTGPHLHLGLYINNQSVDPGRLFQ